MALRQASLAGSRAGTALRREAARRRSKGNGKPAALAGLGLGNATAGGGSSRQIHPSGRREMLPVIGGALAVAAVATGLRYLIRAGGVVGSFRLHLAFARALWPAARADTVLRMSPLRHPPSLHFGKSNEDGGGADFVVVQQ